MPLRVSIRGILVAVLLLPLLPAQNTTAEIAGTITSQDQTALPGATVTITNIASGQQRVTVSDEQGNYALPSLPVGMYTLRADLTNFQPQIREGIELTVAERVRIDLTLMVGDFRQAITVIEATPQLDTASAEVGEIVDNRRVVNLPLNGRKYSDLALLTDNVVSPPRGTRGGALGQTGPSVAVAGQRAGHNMYFLDGVSITDQYFNNLGVSLSIDAMQEFNIQKSIYPAEYGGKASAAISAATKAGGNQVHGSLYEFFRNSALDARNFFNGSKKPPLRQNQFGGTVGGPLLRDRTFFFLNAEALRERRSLTNTFSLPDANLRGGDFSGFAPIYDPLTVDPATGQRATFAGNQIPITRLDPIAQAFLQHVPTPNLAGNVQNYTATPVSSNNNSQFTGRLDHTLGAKDTLMARYTYSNSATFRPFGSSDLNETLVPGFGTTINTLTRNVALAYTHVFSPTILTDLRFGYLHVSGGQQLQNQGYNFGGLNGLQGVTTDPAKTGYPAINLSGAYSSLGDPARVVSRNDTSFDVFSNTSWVHGAHTVKFGGYFFHLLFNPYDSPNARGNFTFTPRFTSSAAGLANGNSFADFLLGYPSSAQAGIGRGSEDGRSSWMHAYIQDDWRARSNVTVNIGLRYEFNGQITDTNNRLSNLQLDRLVIASDNQGNISPDASALLSQIPVPYVTSAQAGYSRSLLRPGYVRLAPRFGLAWSPTSKTVVRTGFGLFFNQWAYSVQTGLFQNLPFYFNKNVTTAADQLSPQYTIANMATAPATGTIGGAGMDQNYRSEYAESWTLSIQHQVAKDWVVEANYFGSKVIGADDTTFYNIPQPGPGPIAARRPNPNLSAFPVVHWGGFSKFNSLTLKVEKRFSNGLSINANYAWSKATDAASSPGPTFSEANYPQNVYYRKAEYGLSSFDHRHRLVVNFQYDLPLGFTVMGFGTFQSGAPFTVNLPNDNANIGPGPAQRPDVLSNPNLAASQQTVDHWFDTSAFVMPQQYTFGNAGRNIVTGDGLANVDLSMLKQIKLREGMNLQIRGEFFNAFNHTNFADSPGRIAFTPSFGRYFAAQDPRQVQIAMKLLF